MTAIEADTLRIAFSEEKPRVVRQGSVDYDGRQWTCRELQAYQGELVSVLVPKYADWSRLPVQRQSQASCWASPSPTRRTASSTRRARSSRSSAATRTARPCASWTAPPLI